MRALIVLILTVAPVLAATPPPCANMPAPDCPGDRKSCNFFRICQMPDLTCRQQMIYVQDCTLDPLPGYCSTHGQPVVVLRVRPASCQ